MLAKNVNDNAQNQINRVVWTFFASKLAPTGIGVPYIEKHPTQPRLYTPSQSDPSE